MDVICSPPALSYPDGGQQTPAALQAIKQLVRLLLAREDASLLEPLAPLPRAGPALLASLGELPAVDLLATIRRQRLECLLHADPYVAELLPILWPSLQHLARRETMAALALASLTREISSLLQQAQIPVLVIKGVPLALQTTNSIAARGRGDLDLFVDHHSLVDAVALLRSQGFFFANPGDEERTLDSSLACRYNRWIGHEVLLLRQHNKTWESIDLHWRLNHRFRHNHDFHRSYLRAEVVKLGDSPISTLNRSDALLHACAHAATDRWMCLRNLVDIYRLERMLPPLEGRRLRRFMVVSISSSVARDCLQRPNLMPNNRYVPGMRLLIKYAISSHQLTKWRATPNLQRSPISALLSKYVTFICADYGLRCGGIESLAAGFMRHALPPGRMFRHHEINNMNIR